MIMINPEQMIMEGYPEYEDFQAHNGQQVRFKTVHEIINRIKKTPAER